MDVNVDQQLLSESAGGDSLPNVPLPDVPLPNVRLSEAHPDISVCEEEPSPRIAEEARGWVGDRFLSCEFPWL